MKHVLNVVIGLLTILAAIAYVYWVGGLTETTNVCYRILIGLFGGAVLLIDCFILIFLSNVIGKAILKSIRKTNKQ